MDLFNFYFWFITGYFIILAFQKILNRKLPVLTQVLLVLLASIGIPSTIGFLIYLILALLIIYFLGFNRSVSFNTISAIFIFTYVFYQLINSVWFRIYQFTIEMPLNASPFWTSLVYSIFVAPLITIGTFLLIIKKISKPINRYNQLVVQQWPVYAWGVNLIAAFFPIFRTSTALSLIKVTIPMYLVILAAYIIGYLLAITLPTRSIEKSMLIQSQQIELTNLAHYTSHIEAMYDELRRFRHDYKNILLSLSDAVENKNIDQVSDIFKRVVIPTNANVETQTSVLGRLADVKDLEIKSLVYSKTMQAIDKGITVEIEVEKPIKLDRHVQVTDMLRIISILFDNAINAATKAAKPQINFSFFNDQERQVIVIANTTAEEQVDLSKLSGHFSGVLTTSHHGLGLRNLRSILARYPFIHNNRSASDHWLEQQIVIYKIEK